MWSVIDACPIKSDQIRCVHKHHPRLQLGKKEAGGGRNTLVRAPVDCKDPKDLFILATAVTF